jgi:methylated-DNA-[protein]-cysteine S-methyltransferase
MPYTLFQTLPVLGSVRVSADAAGVTCVLLSSPDDTLPAPPVGSQAYDLIQSTFAQLKEYLHGSRREFALQTDVAPTSFQRDVWDAVARIPYGETYSYGEIASEIGRPSAARAVGGAVGANPLCIVVPCHRVVAGGGGLGGYAYGLELKRRLLELEGRPPAAQRIPTSGG